MAYPQVADITATTFSSGSTTHNVNMPAMVNANDLLFALFANVANSVTVTTPSGWTSITTQTTTNIRLSVFGKVASGSEDGTTVNFVTSSAIRAAAQVYRITGYYNDLTTNGIDFGVASGVSTTPNSPNLNPTNWDVEETLWITVAACSNAVSAVTTYPSSYTNGTYSQSGSTGGVDAQIASARRENSVSAENPGSFTFNAAANWIALTIAIRPAFISQTIEAPLLENSPIFYDAGLTLSGTLIPPLFENTPAFYDPSFAYEQTLLPELLTNEPTFYGPAVAYTITVPLLDNTPTFYGPEIINTQVLTAPLLSNVPTFYGPEFRGPRNIGAPLLTLTQTFYGPEIFGLWHDSDSLNAGTWTDVDIPT